MEKKDTFFKDYQSLINSFDRLKKDASNPFFKSKYADLNSVIEATDFALEEVGLVYVDRIDNMNLISEIIDFESGESIVNNTPLILTKNDMQQLGSAITYARRYARMSMCGLMAVDDDGNFVSGNTSQNKVVATQDQVLTIQGLLTQTGVDANKILATYAVTNIQALSPQNAEKAISRLTATLTKGAQ